MFITSDSTDILLGQGLISTVMLCFHKISLGKEKQKSMNFQGFISIDFIGERPWEWKRFLDQNRNLITSSSSNDGSFL